MSNRPQTWFEMNDVRKRALARSVWIPLRACRTVKGDDGTEEVFCAGGIAFPPDKRVEAEKLGWSDLGLVNEGKSFAFDDGGYKSVEIYQRNDKEDLGVDLIFVQDVDRPPSGGPGGMLVHGRSGRHPEHGRRRWSGLRSRPCGEGGHEDLRCRWLVVDGAVWTHSIVMPSPAFDDHLGFSE